MESLETIPNMPLTLGGSTSNPVIDCDLQSPVSKLNCADSFMAKIKLEPVEMIDEPVDADVPFSFETEQVALKDNKDYQNLIRSVVMLEAQRATALKDYETLVQLQHEALRDPIAFVQKLQQKIDLGIPKMQHVIELPNISWEDYSTSLKTIFDSCNSKHLTRRKYKRELLNDIKEETDDVLFGSKVTASLSNKLLKPDESSTTSRCRETESKYIAATFNQPWSVEEQKHLEALLIKHPTERFESRRWVKIAQELGNRTPQQVASRVQKYFIKLGKMGLPIPGRMPNLAAYGGKNGLHRHQRYNRFYYPSSTFMASYEPPIFMPEEDNETSVSCSASDAYSSADFFASYDDDFYSDSDIKPDITSVRGSSDCYKSNFLNICQLSDSKERKCLSCNCITSGVSWQCVECPCKTVFICMACSKCDFEKDGHSSKHLLTRV